MERDEHSHKGENGKVAVVGGSRHQHGAPLMSALAAEKSGVDLIYICLPACHEEVAKAASYNFQVHPFHKNDLCNCEKNTEHILQVLATVDAAVIGPGAIRSAESLKGLAAIISAAQCPLVLDASALQPDILESIAGKTAVLTPHRGELERMKMKESDLPSIAKSAGVTICLKGRTDITVSSDGEQEEITGGNTGLTVGGTGDVLSGLIAGLIAQKIDPYEATKSAAHIVKRAGTVLFQSKGFAYTATDIIHDIPHLLHTFE